MVEVKIGDGLGNQLFNYAYGYTFAKKHGERLRLDISDAENSPIRSYQLHNFNLECKDTVYFSNRTIYHKIYKRLRRELCFGVVKENPAMHRCFDAGKMERKGIRNVYLHGYWQHPGYFWECETDVRCQFTPIDSIAKKIRPCLDQIKNSNSCAIHMRGGDIKMLPYDYFKKAIELLDTKQNINKYYIFTNQKDEAKKMANLLHIESRIVFVENMGSFEDVEEFFLMSACRHQIISDSTFSWWAAFLNDNLDKVVIVPQMNNRQDFYLDSWLQI